MTASKTTVSVSVLRNFTSGGLILFNAAAFFEILAPSKSFSSIRTKKVRNKTWKASMALAFQEAYGINYGAVFHFGEKVLDCLPPSPITEAALEDIYRAVEFVVSRGGLWRHDLTGRIYHSNLGYSLAKTYATYYTKISTAELLASLAIDDDNWDIKVADFACGSGTLLVAAYHRKLMLAYQNKYAGNIEDLHTKFLQDSIWGLDAMPFASHLTLVNLSLQQPSVLFTHSNIYHVPCNAQLAGSLELLASQTISVQMDLYGKGYGPTRQTMEEESQNKIKVEKDFDLIIMNPPFTKKDRATQLVSPQRLRELIDMSNPKLSTLAGLGAPFVQVASDYVAKGGRIALVLPSIALVKGGWQAVRELLAENYHIEHLLISWIPGTPSFSESTSIREILIVAKKAREKDQEIGDTIVTRLDSDFDFLEARQLVDQLKLSLGSHKGLLLTKPRGSQELSLGVKPMGEVVAIPSVVMRNSTDNWYRFVAFRDLSLQREALYLIGKHPHKPNHLPSADLLCTLSEICEVKLFMKSIASLGFKVVKTKPGGGGIPILEDVDFSSWSIKDSDCEWLIKDLSLKVKEKFTPKSGRFLIVRRTNIYIDMHITSTVSIGSPITGTMWSPATASELTTSDGNKLTSDEVSRILCVWLNSIFGVLILLMEREETEGPWGEWVTEKIRTIKVLDPRKLTKNQAGEIISLWDKYSQLSWPTIIEQLKEPKARKIREEFDSSLLQILEGLAPQKLGKFYDTLAQEIEKIHSVMHRKNQE
jgi:hypothetical protein